MDFIRTWIYVLCVCAIIISVIKTITPESVSGKCVELASAIIIIIAIITPIKQFKAIDMPRATTDYDAKTEELYEQLTRENEKLKSCIIEENISTYVFDIAKEEGANPLSVSVKTERTEKGIEYPETVELITASKIDEEKKAKLVDKIHNEFAIEKENIRIRRKNETYS